LRLDGAIGAVDKSLAADPASDISSPLRIGIERDPMTGSQARPSQGVRDRAWRGIVYAAAVRWLAAALIAAGLLSFGAPPSSADVTILVKVNDDPITSFDVEQRARLSSLGQAPNVAELKAKLQNEAKRRNETARQRFTEFALAQDPSLSSRKPSKDEYESLLKQFQNKERAHFEQFKQRLTSAPMAITQATRDKALVQLVNDRLRLQEAARLNVVASEDEVSAAIAQIAKDNGKTTKEFEQTLGGRGVRLESFRQRIKAQLSWKNVLSQRGRGQVSVGQLEIDQAVTGDATEGSGTETELQLQKILLLLPAKAKDAAVAARLAEAEQLRSQLTGCERLSQLASTVEGAKFEDLGRVRVAALPEQMRPLLAGAKMGDVTPPQPTAKAVEIYVVCGRAEVKASDEVRKVAREKIQRSKVDALSRRILSELCSSASIAFQNGVVLQKPCGSE
jgi:peptidyl-prolyl cis-trans isomerase SurA